MGFRITAECILCGVCQAECPEGAIREGEDRWTIDPDCCDDCGACAEVCPVGACVPGGRAAAKGLHRSDGCGILAER